MHGPFCPETWSVLSMVRYVPNSLVGTESWLTPDIQNTEIIPPDLGYSIVWKDRMSSVREWGPYFSFRYHHRICNPAI